MFALAPANPISFCPELGGFQQTLTWASHCLGIAALSRVVANVSIRMAYTPWHLYLYA